MKCIDRKELFGFAHHLLEPCRAEQVGAHAAACAACRGILEEYRKLEAVLDEWKAAAPSTWFDSRVRAVLISTKTEKQGFWGLGRARALGLATLAVVALAAAIVIVHVRSEHPQGAAVARTSPAAFQSQAPEVGVNALAQVTSADDELQMYENLSVLEDYDMLANFDVLSELPQADKKVEN